MFIRYNPGIKLWEYDTSPNQTGIGPWVKLPIDPSQLVSGGGGSNIAFTDSPNYFSVQQVFLAGGNGINLQAHLLWDKPNNGPDLKKWHQFVDGNGDLQLYPVNDAQSAVTNGGFLYYRNGDLNVTGRLVTNEGRVVIKAGSSNYALQLEHASHVAMAFHELNAGFDSGKWRILCYNKEWRFEVLNDAESAVMARLLTFARDGNTNVHGVLYTDTYMGSLGVYYPGRVDVATRQYSWYLGTHPSYGLYSNTGMYLTAGLLTPQVFFPAAQQQTSNANGLDDYEEGTWAPRLWGGDGEATSYSTRVGTYTKVGNLVTLGFDVVMQSASWSGGNPLYLYLPFDPVGASGGCAMGYWNANGSFIWITMSLEPGNGRAHFPIKTSTVSAGIDTYLLTGQTGPGTRFSGTLTYSVAT